MSLSDKEVDLENYIIGDFEKVYFQVDIKKFIQDLKKAIDKAFETGFNRHGDFYNIIDKLAGRELVEEKE